VVLFIGGVCLDLEKVEGKRRVVVGETKGWEEAGDS